MSVAHLAEVWDPDPLLLFVSLVYSSVSESRERLEPVDAVSETSRSSVPVVMVTTVSEVSRVLDAASKEASSSFFAYHVS